MDTQRLDSADDDAAAHLARPPRSDGIRRWNLVGVATLTAYSTALGWFAHGVGYPLLGQVGAGDFAAYHQFYNKAILWPVIVPGFVGFLAATVFPWTRPREVPRPAALLVGATGLTCLASTLLWAIPMHDRLDAQGFAIETLDNLLAANLVRTIALTTGTLTLGWCLRRMLP